jgi:hypothetical protein
VSRSPAAAGGHAGGDLTDIADPGNCVVAQQQHQRGRHDQGDQGAEQAEPGPRQEHEDGEGTDAGEHGGQVDLGRVQPDVHRLGQRDVALRSDTGQVGKLAQDDVHRDAGQEPEHHGVRDEPDVAPHP